MNNSLSRRKEILTPPTDGIVKIFVCGPTVYDYAHLGHARTYVAFDIMARYLKFLGYKIRTVVNITDVAERIVDRAEDLKRDPLEFAREYEKAFLEDMQSLGISEIDGYERASEYVPQMISQVRQLIDKGAAYETDTGVYFDVNKFPSFGKLSGQSKEELGLRRLELCSSKRNPEDFSIWRKYEKGFGWDSPWGFGRPGWHIEDTAISMTNLGETYDIHGGASELIFPHHEAEIAQAEALTGMSPFVRFWLHTGLLNVKGRKMSKSLGNVIRIRDALRKYKAPELRYYFASFHYREPLVMSETELRQPKRELQVLERNFNAFMEIQPRKDASSDSKKLRAIIRNAEKAFRQHMDNDFDTPKALRSLKSMSEKLSIFAKPTVRVDRQSKLYAEEVFRRMAEVFGILSR